MSQFDPELWQPADLVFLAPNGGVPLDPTKRVRVPKDEPERIVTFVLKPEFAFMKQRIATCPLLLEAEEMGFRFTVDLPKESVVRVVTYKDDEEES